MNPKSGPSDTLYWSPLHCRSAGFVAVVCVVLEWATSHNVRAEERVVRIVVLGDFLTAGQGVPAEAGIYLSSQIGMLLADLPGVSNVL